MNAQGSSNVKKNVAIKDFLKEGIALVALSYKSPMTLLNSMISWKSTGLLDLVQEKIIILNDPSPEEYAISLEYGFRIVEPRTIKNAKVC